MKERDGSNNPLVSYTRGNDLSGTMEGLPRERIFLMTAVMSATAEALAAIAVADLSLLRGKGGIGGLLARSDGYSSGNFATHNYYFADGNGNVTYMLNSSRAMVASYRYGPIGNTISSSGTLASANVYRFSSKEIHANSGMYYYGYRFYDPNLQRWLNRDPLQEAGGINLYGFTHNDPVEYVDTDGRGIFKLPPIEIPWPKLPPIEIPWPPFPWPKPKLPLVNPPNSVRCAGYLPFIGSTCDGGKPDPYPAGAYKCCKDFMDKYKCPDKTQCVANCLRAGEANCQTEESCSKRNDCRKQAHVDCYTKCGFVPVKGVPASCIAIGLTGL